MITQVAQKANELRWQVEEFHRELKQLTGTANANVAKLALSAITSLVGTMLGFP